MKCLNVVWIFQKKLLHSILVSGQKFSEPRLIFARNKILLRSNLPTLIFPGKRINR